MRPFGKSRMQRCRKRKQWRKVQERQQWWDWLCRTPWLNGVGCLLSIFIGVFCYQFLLVLSSLVVCYHFLLVFIFVDCVVSTLSLSWVGSKPAMMLQTERLVLFHKLNSKAAFEIWGGSRRGEVVEGDLLPRPGHLLTYTWEDRGRGSRRRLPEKPPSAEFRLPSLHSFLKSSLLTKTLGHE